MIDGLSVLLSRLTAARAAFLDAAVTSIAPSSTAVSSATWTAARAAFLDAAVSGRAASIKSIQAGTITLATVTSNTATISSVNTAKSVLIYLGHTYQAADAVVDAQFVRVALTNGTTITATRANATSTAIVSYIIVEFN